MVIKVGLEFLKNPSVERRSKVVPQKVKKDDSFLDGFISSFSASYQMDGDKGLLDIQYSKPCAALGADMDFGEVTLINCLWQLPEIWNKERTKWLIDFKESPKTDYYENLEKLVDWGCLGPCVKDREELHTIWRGDRIVLKKIIALLKQRGERHTQEPPVPKERSDNNSLIPK